MVYTDEKLHLLPKSGGLQEDGDSTRYYSIKRSETTKKSPQCGKNDVLLSSITQMLRAIPAVLVVASWNIMLSVPFGSTFFSEDVPIPSRTKEKLGMRMAMMALGVGQAAMGGWLSGFEALTVWATGEIAPFYKTFAEMAAQSCGNDPSKIYSTTVYLISLSTIVIGICYFVCGYFQIGKLLSFFPSYVTLGFVAGIGVWAITVAMTVSVSSHIFVDPENPHASPEWWNYLTTPQFALSMVLALLIRPIRKVFPNTIILDPLYFLSIPIVFYCVIAVLGIGFDEMVEAGYMFKAPSKDQDLGDDDIPSIWHEAFQLWILFDISKVKWEVAIHAAPQIFAASIFIIMISVPFIPPIATLLQTDDFSPDKEFMAHGISNIISGLVLPGGVPVCVCYSSTVLYWNSGGKGKFSNFLLVLTSMVSFVYGPYVAGYLPRCMASSILIDMGIALFLEGVVYDDSLSKYDPMEYTSIWIILTIMSVFDMTSGLIAGLFMALFTSTYTSSGDDPVRRVCDADTFPSSKQRKDVEMTFLDDPFTGRRNITIFQLQGSLFFGNISKIQERLFRFLEKQAANNGIVIFDCTLVNSLDSSACIFFDKIQSVLRKEHGVVATVFVASPPKLELEKASDKTALEVARVDSASRRTSLLNEANPFVAFSQLHSDGVHQLKAKRNSITTRGSYGRTFLHQDLHIHGTCYKFLDNALQSCEDKLLSLARVPVAPLGLTNNVQIREFSTLEDDDSDRTMALELLKIYCATENLNVLNSIADAMKRETLPKGKVIWNLGDQGTSAKLFLRGSVFVYVLEDGDDNRFRSSMVPGSFLGLRSLVLDERHLATARCDEDCLFYSMSHEAYSRLVKESPEAARVLELSMARYLSRRLRHPSNRIYQARSVPV